MTRARAILMAALVALAPFSVRGQSASDNPIETFALDNGLEVIVIPNHRVPAVSHMVWYRVGAADDPQGKSGLAHFHEHIMFQGTAKYKSGEYADIISRNGGQQNAFTGHDATSYYVTIAKEQLPLAMALEADRMRGLKPSDADMAKEKQVIIEERRQRIENNPDALLEEQMNAALFRHHPYHIPVIGWMHEMAGLGKEDVLAFHRRYYHPNNAILIVSGDITAKELRPLAQTYYGGLPKADIPRRVWNEEPPQIAERRVVLHHPNVKQASFVRSYMAASLAYGKKDQALPLFVLSQIAGSGKTSRLYQSLVVKQKLATAVDTNYSGFNIGPATFDVRLVPEQGVSLETLEAALDKELAALLAAPLSEAEMQRAKTLLKAESIYARDGLTSMARIMGWLRMAGLPYDYFSLWPELIDKVSAEQVQTAAADTIKPAQSATGYLLPATKEAP